MAIGRKTGGRQKGTPNRITRDVRELILAALDAQEGGGIGFLTRQAKENPRAFMTLVGKIIPREVTAEVQGASLEELLRLAWERRRDDGRVEALIEP